LYSDEEFNDTGLALRGNQEFRRTLLPNAFVGAGNEDKIVKALAILQGMKNPKPDRIYGLSPKTYPAPVGSIVRDETQQLLTIAPALHHPFFIIEGKSSKGDMTVAQMQACRGAATIIHTTRILLYQTGQIAENEELGPDRRPFIYSSTMDANMMKFWVHFALVERTAGGQKRTAYHMERIAEISYCGDPENPRILRRICHNILEWGTRGREDMLAARCQTIYRFDDHFVRDAAVKSLEEGRKSSPKKRKIGGSGRGGGPSGSSRGGFTVS